LSFASDGLFYFYFDPEDEVDVFFRNVTIRNARSYGREDAPSIKYSPTRNKLLIYKTILKPIWTYGIQLWGTVSTSNIEILERFQSKALRMIVDAPWYVPNTVIRRDLQILRVKEEIRRYSAHPNDL
jgi:hypothetical protein